MSQVNPSSSSYARDVAPRVPISFRLPPQIVSAVDDFAASNHLSKTDAFMFFVQKGIDGYEAAPSAAKLEVINERLERIEELLQRA